MSEKLEFVRDKLKDSRMVEVADKSGISMRTLSNIKNGVNPRYSTLDVLYRYFKRRESK